LDTSRGELRSSRTEIAELDDEHARGRTTEVVADSSERDASAAELDAPEPRRAAPSWRSETGTCESSPNSSRLTFSVFSVLPVVHCSFKTLDRRDHREHRAERNLRSHS
jgi:hypothetical protein